MVKWWLNGAMMQWWNGEINIYNWWYGVTTRKKYSQKNESTYLSLHKFPRFYLIIWYLKHWILYIYIMYVVCSLFEGIFVHCKFPIFLKCITIFTGIPYWRLRFFWENLSTANFVILKGVLHAWLWLVQYFSKSDWISIIYGI